MSIPRWLNLCRQRVRTTSSPVGVVTLVMYYVRECVSHRLVSDTFLTRMSKPLAGDCLRESASNSSGKLMCAIRFQNAHASLLDQGLLGSRMSAHVLMTWPLREIMLWLKLKPLRLKAIVETPSAANQMPTTGQAAKKEMQTERLLLKAGILKDETTEVAMGCNICYTSLLLGRTCIHSSGSLLQSSL